MAEEERRSMKSLSSNVCCLCIPQDVTFLTLPPAAVCKLLTATVSCWAERCWTTSDSAAAWSSFSSGWHRHVLSTDLMLTGTAKSPSRAKAISGFHLPSLCILGQKLHLDHLSAGFIWNQDVRDLGHALLEEWRAPWEDYPVDLFSLTCSTGTAVLPSPQETSPLKAKTQSCFLNPTECKINPSAGGKIRRNTMCKFCKQLCRHLTSVAHFCPACNCCQKSFAIPMPILEEVASLFFGDCGPGQQLGTVLDFRSFSFTCLLHRAVTMRKSLSHLAGFLLHWATQASQSWANSTNNFSGTQLISTASGHYMAYIDPFIF